MLSPQNRWREAWPALHYRFASGAYFLFGGKQAAQRAAYFGCELQWSKRAARLLQLNAAFALVWAGLFWATLAMAQIPALLATDEATLSTAIDMVNASVSRTYIIEITENITLTTSLAPIFGSVIINGNDKTLSGGDVTRIFMVRLGDWRVGP